MLDVSFDLWESERTAYVFIPELEELALNNTSFSNTDKPGCPLSSAYSDKHEKTLLFQQLYPASKNLPTVLRDNRLCIC